MKKTFLMGSLVGLFFMLFLATTVSAAVTYSDEGINDTNVKVNDVVLFHANWTTNATSLIHYIFSWNESGSWVNDTAVSLTDWSNVTKTITALHKPTIGWIIYARDSDNTWNNTGIQPFTVLNTAPTDPTGITGFPTNLYVGNSLTVTASGGTDADSDSIIYYYKFYNVNDTTMQDWSSTNSYTIQSSDLHDTIRVYAKSTTTDANSSGTYSKTDFVDGELMLQIDDLDVYVDDKKDSNLDDGDTIDKEAKPESTIKFDFKIENLFDEDEDIEIEDIVITVTIKDIDDGDDLEEETREFDLDAEEKSSIKSLEFDLPMDVEQDDYEIEIIVEGEEKDSNIEHRVEWTLTLEVEKEKNDMKLKRAEFDQSTLSCDRETTFSVKLVNFGRSDEDEIILTIQNTALGINIKEEDLEIDEGDYWSKSYTITVGDDVSPGTYKVITKMYYDSSDYYDKDFELNAYGSTDLVIKKCVVTTPAEEEEEEEEEDIIIVEPGEEEEEEITPGEITREVSFMDTSLYLVLLVTAVVILAGIFLTMIFRLFPRR